ncbi:MAG: hypothetical protein SGJ09_14870 [Phycisphaerae bacterium]|nr:hypothetical protein [Phycisphaerae bacterium]
MLIGCLRPLWALAIVMAMFPIEQCLQANAAIFIQQSTLTNLLVTCIVTVGIIRLSIAKKLVLRHWIHPVLICITLLLGYAAVSYFWTFSPEWLADYIRKTLPYLFLVVIISPLLISSVDDLRELRTAVMVVGSVVSILLIANPNFKLSAGRYVLSLDAATVSNPLVIGSLGGMLVLAAVLVPPPDGVRRFPLVRVAAFIAGLGLGFLSGSRGQVLFALVCAVVFYPMARRLRSWGSFAGLVAAVVVVGFGVMGVASFFVSSENESRWTSEALVYGGEGRWENTVDLANAYFARPAYWPVGLGCLAFHDLPTRSGDPYTHVLVADLIFELGIPGATLGLIIVVMGTVFGTRLFRMVAGDPKRRADVAFLLAYATYQFLLANKAGQLWGLTDLFMIACLVSRVSLLERDRQVLAAASDPLLDDSTDVADEDTADDYPRGRLVTA